MSVFAQKRLQIFAATIAAATLVLSLANPFAASAEESTFGVRIVNGAPVAEADEYPWMVALVRRAEPNNFQAQFCGGTLISQNVVLTAAHCLDGFRRATDIQVLVGSKSLSAPQASRVNVVQMIMHRSYNRSSLRNDIGLLVLAQSQQGVFPSLATSTPSNGTSVTALGWGAVSADARFYPDALQFGELKIDESCSGWGSFDPVSMVCALGVTPNFADTCSGDSGGPLFRIVGDRPELVGVTSWGSMPCAIQNVSGGYVRVSSFNQWVADSLLPRPRSASPSTAVVGGLVRIRGNNMASVATVNFAGGVSAPVEQATATAVTVRVPAGAVTGPISVQSSFESTQSVTLTRNLSIRAPRPAITALDTTSVAPGDLVTITGQNLSTARVVRLGRVVTVFEVIDDSTIQFIVPTGVRSGRVTVETNGGRVTSRQTLRISSR